MDLFQYILYTLKKSSSKALDAISREFDIINKEGMRKINIESIVEFQTQIVKSEKREVKLYADDIEGGCAVGWIDVTLLEPKIKIYVSLATDQPLPVGQIYSGGNNDTYIAISSTILRGEILTRGEYKPPKEVTCIMSSFQESTNITHGSN